MCATFISIPKEELRKIIREVEFNLEARPADEDTGVMHQGHGKDKVKGEILRLAALAQDDKGGAQDDVGGVRGDKGGVRGDREGAGKAVYPKSLVPVVVPDMSKPEAPLLEARELNWGYHVPWAKTPVFNTKIETATGLKPNMWRESILERRCLVPSFGFFEPHKTATHPSPTTGKPNKDRYLFTSASGPLLWMAGIYDGDHFSLMTTEPNASVVDIHPRMPLVLEPSELTTWLYGDYASLADRSAVVLDNRRVA